MDFEALKALFEDFDVAAFLPELETALGWIEMFLRIAVMAGPLLLLLFGLIYLLVPPKEANYSLGYRFWWGMASLEAWQYTQSVAGKVWTAMGVSLTVILALICNAFRRMDPMAMVWTALVCIIVELVLIGGSCIAINSMVKKRYDKDGYLREDI